MEIPKVSTLQNLKVKLPSLGTTRKKDETQRRFRKTKIFFNARFVLIPIQSKIDLVGMEHKKENRFWIRENVIRNLEQLWVTVTLQRWKENSFLRNMQNF